MQSIEHPVAHTMSRYITNGDWDSLLVFAESLSSTVYSTAAEHRLCTQLSHLVRKYPFPKGVVSADPDGKATRIFHRFERRCLLTNRKFRLFDTLRSPHENDLCIARSWIKYVLGDLNLPDIWDLCDFGPGASIGVHGNATNSARKLLAKKWSVTPSAFYYTRTAMKNDVHIVEGLMGSDDTPFFSLDPEAFNKAFESRVDVIDHNKIVFVPKTATVSRTIAVEPLLNGYVQKGIDLFMRKRLKRVGIDLTDQTRNRDLAFIGSRDSNLTDPYCTIDLSSASDSISIELCRNLLPPDWFDFLNSLRSKRYSLAGKSYQYEKFTSMGNGFCFPLETLIFASICEVSARLSHTKADYSVYGDDIIVRSSLLPDVLRLLKVFGFVINTNKTCVSGPFRESCGADWFEGEDVRPISLDYAFDTVECIFKFSNMSRSKGHISMILYEGLQYLQSLIPKELLFVRPFPGPADSALEVPWDVFLTSPFSRFDIHCQAWSWFEIGKAPFADKGVRCLPRYNIALMRGALTGCTNPVPFSERRKSCTKITKRFRSSDPNR
jgi:hypothetical protein